MKYDAFTLKWIAIIGMVLNHIVFAWWEVLPLWLAFPLYAAGGVTFPIMAYFVVEGYKHTSNLKRYFLRLFVFGLISMPFHILVFRSGLGMNILFTIMLSLLALIMYDKIKVRVVFWILFVLLLVVSVIFLMDWYIIGPIVVLMYYIIKKESTRRLLPGIVAGAFWFIFLGLSLLSLMSIEAMIEAGYEVDIAAMGLAMDFFTVEFFTVGLTFLIGCILGAFLVRGYNGERGRRMKWVFYAFYPIHLAVLAMVSLALGLIDFTLFGLMQ